MASERALGERFVRNGLGFTNAYVIAGVKAQDVLSGKLKLFMPMADAGAGKKAAKNAATKGKAVAPIEACSSDDDEVQVLNVKSAGTKKNGSGLTTEEEITAACFAELKERRAQSAAEEDMEEYEVIDDHSLQVSSNFLSFFLSCLWKQF